MCHSPDFSVLFCTICVRILRISGLWHGFRRNYKEQLGILRHHADISDPARSSLCLVLNANQGDPTMTRNLTAKRFIFTALGIAGLYAAAHILMLLHTFAGMVR